MDTHSKQLGLLPQAIELLLQFPQKLGWIYRGQPDVDWDLIPQAGRKPYLESALPVRPEEPLSKSNPTKDLGRFNHWRELSAGYSTELPENDFECLAAAQHYGLPTRLLDFSENPLCALYFATESHFDRDGAVFAHFPQRYINKDILDIYNVPAISALRIKPFDKRILAQRAIFLFFPDPSQPLEPEKIPEECAIMNCGEFDVVKFAIPKASKLIIHRQLVDIGVTRRTLFPDLDGLSRDFVAEDLYQQAFDAANQEREKINSSNKRMEDNG